MIKYKIILKTSHRHVARVEDCLATWLKDLDYVCLTDKLTGNFNELSGSDRDDYHSAEEKTCFLLNKVKTSDDFDEYDWLVFIDDDAILNAKMLDYIIPYFNKDYVYGLPMTGCPKQPELLFPSGGSGYFISPSLIKKSKNMVNQDWGLEDVSIGQWMKDNEITLVNYFYIDEKRYTLKLNGWFPFSEESTKLTATELSSREMYINKAFYYIGTQRKSFIISHLTHHYLRYRELMYLINGYFKNWQIEDLEI